MASIRKRGKVWRAEVMVAGVRASSTHRTKQEAAQWALTQEAGLAAPTKAHTLRDALETFKRKVTPNHKGARWEELRLDALMEAEMAGKRLSKLGRGDLTDWRDARLTEVAPGTVAREMNLLRSVLTHAVEWGWLNVSPMKGVKTPTTPASRKRRVTDAEIDRVMLAAGLADGWKADTAIHRTALAFLFALETAMRAGEIAGIRWEDVGEKSVTLPRTKNGDVRQVPLSPRAREILALLPRGSDTAFGIQPATRDVLWRRIVRAAGVPDLHFHDSRAEAIWRLSRVFNIMELARIIGHKNYNSIQFYYNTSADDLADRL